MKYLNTILIYTALQLFSVLSLAEDSIKKVNHATNPFDVMPFALPKVEPTAYTNYRKSWNRLTGFEYSGLHWQQFVSIYVNKGADIYRDNYLAYLSLYREDEDDDEDDEDEKSISTIFKEYDLGTIFLKENYLSDKGKPGTPSSLTIMIKREQGYDTAGGNWEYLQTDSKGNVIIKGDSTNIQIKKLCSDCHANMAERDYIFSTFLTSSTHN